MYYQLIWLPPAPRPGFCFSKGITSSIRSPGLTKVCPFIHPVILRNKAWASCGWRGFCLPCSGQDVGHQTIVMPISSAWQFMVCRCCHAACSWKRYRTSAKFKWLSASSILRKTGSFPRAQENRFKAIHCCKLEENAVTIPG